MNFPEDSMLLTLSQGPVVASLHSFVNCAISPKAFWQAVLAFAHVQLIVDGTTKGKTEDGTTSLTVKQ